MTGDSSLRDDIKKALARVESAETVREKAEPDIVRSPTAPASARSLAMRLAIWVWALYIGAMSLFITLGGETATKEPIDLLLEVMKVGILPTVTFVIGHCFGSQER
jgi:hypothetical protein